MAEYNNTNNGFRKKKKVCQLCAGKSVTYKDEIIKKYVSNTGKVLPRRVTGNCAEHQRVIAKEVKKARFMGILPYTNAN